MNVGTSRSISGITTGAVATGRGIVTFASVAGGTLVLTDTASGVELLSLADADKVALHTPVRFTGGLTATVSAGAAIVHIG